MLKALAVVPHSVNAQNPKVLLFDNIYPRFLEALIPTKTDIISGGTYL